MGVMTDAAQPWAPLMNMFSPQRRVATDADPQTDNLGSAHQTSDLPTPPLMDMSKQHPTAQGGIPSSLEPDTIQPPGGSTPVGADALAAGSVPTDGNMTKNGNPADGLDKAPDNEKVSIDLNDNRPEYR